VQFRAGGIGALIGCIGCDLVGEGCIERFGIALIVAVEVGGEATSAAFATMVRPLTAGPWI
jgi:hypothetical protein